MTSRGILIVGAALSVACGSTETDSVPSSTLERRARFQPLDGAPPGYEAAEIVHDTARDRMVLVGGRHDAPDSFRFIFYSNTYERIDDEWVLIEDPTLPPRTAHALAYDPVRERTVLTGGLGPCGDSGPNRCCGDTWEWDGAVWTRGADGAPPRLGAALVFDADRGALLLVSGELCSDADDGGVYAYDGAGWEAL